MARALPSVWRQVSMPVTAFTRAHSRAALVPLRSILAEITCAPKLLLVMLLPPASHITSDSNGSCDSCRKALADTDAPLATGKEQGSVIRGSGGAGGSKNAARNALLLLTAKAEEALL